MRSARCIGGRTLLERHAPRVIAEAAALYPANRTELVQRRLDIADPQVTHRLAGILLIALIALLGAALRLAPLMHSDLSFSIRPDDSYEYVQLAAGMRAGCGFARMIDGACQKPEILRTPGYPLFLASGAGVRWSLAAQGILGGIVCLIIGTWLWSYGYGRGAVLAAALIALDLPSIVMATELMSEAVFQFVLVLTFVPIFLAGWRARRPLAAGLLAGLAGGTAVMVRPIGLLLPILLPVPFLITTGLSRRLKLASAAIACGISASIPAAWAMRNYAVAHYPGISTVMAINLYYYRAADATARDNNAILSDTRDALGPALGVSYEHIYEANVQSDALARRMKSLAFGILKTHWKQAAAMTLQSAAYLAVAPMRSPVARMIGTAGSSKGDGLASGAPSLGRVRATLARMFESPTLTVLVVLEALLTAFTCIGVAIAVVRSRWLGGNYRVWVLYTTFVAILLFTLAAGGEADVRFRAPIIPLLAAVAALGYFPQIAQR